MRYLINSPAVITENMLNEFIILNLDSGKYYSALETGAIAWQLFSNAYTLEEASTILSTHFLVPIEQVTKDLNTFLKHLTTDNLIKSCDATAPKTAPSLSLSKHYITPTITTYTDMETLLLADPVHQVENMGWPNTK